MTAIHPSYRYIEKPDVAAVLSEPLLQPSKFEKMGHVAAWPRQPTAEGIEPLSVTAQINANISNGPAGRKLQLHLGLSLDGAEEDAVIDALVTGFAAVVGPPQDFNRRANEQDGPDSTAFTDYVKRLAAYQAQADGLRTVASFAVCSSVDKQRHYPILIVPKRTTEQMHLAIRELLLVRRQDIINQQQDPTAVFGQYNDEIRRVIQNDYSIGGFAVYAAAAVFPSVRQVQAMFGRTIKP